MTHIKFEIPPRPKGRPRFAKRHAHTPKLTSDYEYTIAQEYLLKGLKKHLGAISVFITFNYRIAQSRVKKLRHGDICTEKAGINNLCKAVLHALDGVAYLNENRFTKCQQRKNGLTEIQ